MHIWTRLKAASQGKTGLGIYPDGMVEHDAMVGQLLDKLKELGLEDTTIVMYSTDNGAEKFTWPDGGQSPFRGEKNTNWEGGYRVPRDEGEVTPAYPAHPVRAPGIPAAGGAQGMGACQPRRGTIVTEESKPMAKARRALCVPGSVLSYAGYHSPARAIAPPTALCDNGVRPLWHLFTRILTIPLHEFFHMPIA
jgi:hypothetical protein